MKQTEVTVGAPSWAEITTAEPPAAKAFYGELFGWRAETDPRPQAGGYTVMHLGDAAAAGLSPLYGPAQRTAWTVSFAVQDADATVARVTSAGGQVLMEPMEVLDIGRFAVVADPSGAAFSLWQARTFAGAGVFNDPGALGWVELLTRDTEGAEAFYPAVFGWTVNTVESYTQWGLAGDDFGGMLAMGEQFPPDLPPHWLPYFAVGDVDGTAARAATLGGEVLMPPTTVPAGPRIAVLKDPQGAAFGVYRAGTEG
ncbi:VOC family protein [Kitasatospora herbaricolor]|uniref:VOC family protein n=1 Tax=Kitasatospora herbaricolor TaxID=68217 RepID=A0ABZ1W4L2_9ACTN|nr:VOC family protein [Kitasatospora herbaricolor]